MALAARAGPREGRPSRRPRCSAKTRSARWQSRRRRSARAPIGATLCRAARQIASRASSQRGRAPRATTSTRWRAGAAARRWWRSTCRQTTCRRSCTTRSSSSTAGAATCPSPKR
eukprot:2305528-Pleurochrysis_carterae.AAC.1